MGEEVYTSEQLMLVLSGEGPRVTTELATPLHYANTDDVRLALTKITFYNSFPNIEKGRNNQLKVIPGTGEAEITVAIPTGAYEINEINTEIIYQLSTQGAVDADKHFKLAPNLATLKSMITLSGNYAVDFNVDDSISTVLGFSKSDKLRSNKQSMVPRDATGVG